MVNEHHFLWPIINKECDVVVETGTYQGETTCYLEDLPQIREVYTIELDLFLFENARNSFKNLNKISAWHGDSPKILPFIFKEISPESKVCVFLDAHYSGGCTARGKLASPLQAELEVLQNYAGRIHQIIIDDIQVCYDVSQGRAYQTIYHEGWPAIEKVEELIKNILPDQKIEVDKEIRPYWILYTV
jgi:hypothetical protein